MDVSRFRRGTSRWVSPVWLSTLRAHMMIWWLVSSHLHILCIMWSSLFFAVLCHRLVFLQLVAYNQLHTCVLSSHGRWNQLDNSLCFDACAHWCVMVPSCVEAYCDRCYLINLWHAWKDVKMHFWLHRKGKSITAMFASCLFSAHSPSLVRLSKGSMHRIVSSICG